MRVFEITTYNTNRAKLDNPRHPDPFNLLEEEMLVQGECNIGHIGCSFVFYNHFLFCFK